MNTHLAPAFAATLALCLSAAPALADGCDWKPSRLASKASTAVAETAASRAKSAGQYVLMHPGSGVALAGQVATGTGTAGALVSGTGAIAGGVVNFLMAPVTLVAGAVTFAGVATYEGVCWFRVERVTDAGEVRAILDNVAEADPDVRIIETSDGDALLLSIGNERRRYDIDRLYIADGVLKSRDWGPNTTLGPIAFTALEADEN